MRITSEDKYISKRIQRNELIRIVQNKDARLEIYEMIYLINSFANQKSLIQKDHYNLPKEIIKYIISF